MGIFMILLGIAGMIVNSNGWFIVPSLAINVCFVVGGLIIFFRVINVLLIHDSFKR